MQMYGDVDEFALMIVHCLGCYYNDPCEPQL